MPAEFVHLHVHTQFSFLVSTVKLEELVTRTAELGMRAVALTDHGNMFGAIRHYKKCRGAGCPASWARAERREARRAGRGRSPGGAGRDEEGYATWSAGLALADRVRSSTAPSVTLEDFAPRSKGLIGLSGLSRRRRGAARAGTGPEQAGAVLGELAEIFEPGSVFVELQDHGLPEQPVLNDILLARGAGSSTCRSWRRTTSSS